MNNVMKNVMNRQMMKTMLWATTIALGALCMTGCSNDDDTDAAPTPGTPQLVTMTMQTVPEPQTRAGYTDNGSEMLFSWHSGDKISVEVDGVDANKNCELTTTKAEKSAPFNGTVTNFDGEKTIYAIYPYSAAGYTVTDGKVTLTLPNPQEYSVGGPLTNCYLVGKGTATSAASGIDASVSMKQVMSFIKLNITNAPAGVTGVKMTDSNGVESLQTEITVEVATGKQSGIYTKRGVVELTMDVTDPTGTADKEIYFAILPQDKSAGFFTITVTFDDGSVKTIPAKKGLQFQRNMHYVVDVDAAPAPVITNKALITAIETAASVSFEKNTDNDVVLTGANKAKIAVITELDISGKSLTSLDGIEYFTELTELNCNNNQLTTLNVSKLKNLTRLNCNENQLTDLAVSELKDLARLQCYNNRLSALDVSLLTKLELKINKLLCGNQTSDGSAAQDITVTVTQAQNDGQAADWAGLGLNTGVTLVVAGQP